MNKPSPQKAVDKYYSRIGSRLGYNLIMGRSQHFGYYDKNHTKEPQAQEKYHREFKKILKLKSGMKVLDAGCGQGVLACWLAKNTGASITGITITHHEVKNARKLADKNGVSDKTDFLLADYASMPFKDMEFDRIYTTETLSHAVDLGKVLKEFKRVLKPGGRIVCSEYEFDYDKFDEQAHEAAEFVKEHAAIHGIYQFEKGGFEKRLGKLGFKNIKASDWTKYVEPSFTRLARIAEPIRRLISLFGMEKHFVNTSSARMYVHAAEKKAFFYKVYSADKPK